MEKSESEAPETPKDIKVSRETCLRKGECRSDVCTPSDCKDFKTDVLARRVYNGAAVCWIVTCSVTNESVGPIKEEDFTIDDRQVASQLGVRVKDVWTARIKASKDALDVKISDLKANLIGQPITINVQIVGEASQKAIPKRLVLRCVKCGAIESFDLDDLRDETSVLEYTVFRRLSELTKTIQSQQPCEKGPQHNWHFEPCTEFMDFTILFVIDLLDPLVKFDSRIYQTKKLYLVGQVLPFAKKVTLKGVVSLDPGNRDLTVICDHVAPYEDEVTSFKVTKKDQEDFSKYFAAKNPEDLLTQVAPALVGRPLAQEALLLVLHSICVIPNVYGELIRGSIRGTFYGDTKTSKTTAAKDLSIDHYGLGDYLVGEASSRTGITYAIDNDSHALIWGALALNDLGFLVIDGMHSLHAEEWKETREALENQRIVVRRSLSGEALARTRVLGIFNPGKNKPMNSYVFKCQGITDTFCFSDPPDVTRWDFFLPFSRGDVEEGAVVHSRPLERPVPDNVFLRHVFWAWSRRPEHIEYTHESRNAVLSETQLLIRRYAVDPIPICHLGYREVITRAAVAYAAWLHSTDVDHEKVIVKQEHVEMAVQFLSAVMGALELGEYKLEAEGRLKISGSELEQIISELDSECLRIIDEIKIVPKTSAQLAEILDSSVATIKRRYALLSKHQLIHTTPGKGVSLSPRGITFLKHYLGVKGIKVSKTDTIKGEKVAENDTLTPASSIGEKLSNIRRWIFANKDSNSRIDAIRLAAKIKELDLDPQQIIRKLKEDVVIFDVDEVGKLGVVV